jgi:hypothetical protein
MSLRKAFLYSLEWRVFGFIITTVILLANGTPIVSAGIVSLQLNVALTLGHMFWFYYRHRDPAFSHAHP